jgi:GLPGLI family protein
VGYTCQNAVLENEKQKTIAWFTPDIPVSTGPGEYTGLPGLFLEVDINNGQNVFTAQTIDLTPPSKKQITKPKEGKKVNQEEFDIIKAEKIKEWEEMAKQKKKYYNKLK